MSTSKKRLRWARKDDRYFYEDDTFGYGHVFRITVGLDAGRWGASGPTTFKVANTLKEAKQLVERNVVAKGSK